MESSGWTLHAWIEHDRALRDADIRYLETRVEILERELRHERELSARQAETNNIHFAKLSKTVTLDRFQPFEEYVKDWISRETGQDKGSTTTINWISTGIGVMIGFFGLVVAVLSLIL